MALALLAGACSSANTESPALEAVSSPTTSELAVNSSTTSLPESSETTTVNNDAEDSEQPSTSPLSGSVPLGEEQFSDEAIEVLFDNLGLAYSNVDGKWAGFDPNEHPVVIAVRLEDGTHLGALAINHPEADAMGDATELSVVGTPFISAHRIENVNDDDLATLNGVTNFDFFAMVGGVDSFLIEAGTDEFFNLATVDYASTVLHEMFHRYQGFAFTGFNVGQDIEGYDYSAENLALATLEERALERALDSADSGTRRRNAEYFAALRMVRLDRDDRVVLDDAQEAVEGSARYIEHLSAGNDTAFTYHYGNYTSDLVTDAPQQGAKDHFGFGRWYSSGAAALAILEQLGVDDFDVRLQGGEAISSMLALELSVTADNMDALVDAARKELDADNKIEAQAVASAEAALTEGSVFGDDDEHGHGADGSREDADVPIEEGSDNSAEDGELITDEELACMEAEGFDFETDVEINDAVFEACLS